MAHLCGRNRPPIPVLSFLLIMRSCSPTLASPSHAVMTIVPPTLPPPRRFALAHQGPPWRWSSSIVVRSATVVHSRLPATVPVITVTMSVVQPHPAATTVLPWLSLYRREAATQQRNHGLSAMGVRSATSSRYHGSCYHVVNSSTRRRYHA